MPTSDLNTAIRAYESKIREKTKGGYRIVEMNYEADEEPTDKKVEEKN